MELLTLQSNRNGFYLDLGRFLPSQQITGFTENFSDALKNTHRERERVTHYYAVECLFTLAGVCERESVCVCERERACVCVCERERACVSLSVCERESACVCVYVRESVCVCV